MTGVFFYGLFMDTEILEDLGLHPKVVGKAELKGYSIRIAERATLIPDEVATVYGVVMELEDSELANLYAQSGLDDYCPVAVEAIMATGRAALDTICYILPANLSAGTPNRDYARRLALLVEKLGFPESYAGVIRGACDDQAGL